MRSLGDTKIRAADGELEAVCDTARGLRKVRANVSKSGSWTVD